MTTQCPWLQSLVLLLVSIFLPACFAAYSYKDVEVIVTDAESGAPIAGAEIDIRYLVDFPVLNAPRPKAFVADDAGRVKARVADWEGGVLWRYGAPGFMPFDGLDPVFPDPGNNFWRYRLPDSGKLNFRLFREPRPESVLVVPDDYHGPVTLDFTLAEHLEPHEIGKRRFEFVTGRNGSVRSVVPLLLWRHFSWPDMTVRSASGRAIPQENDPAESSRDDAVSFRHVQSDHYGQMLQTRHRVLGVIGTHKEYKAVWSRIHPRDKDGVTSLDYAAFDAMFLSNETRASAATRND